MISQYYAKAGLDDYKEALLMAIEALNQFVEDSKKVSADGQDLISRQEDLISREVALTHIDDVPYIKDHPNVGLLWKAWIENLPPAHPEKRTQERTETHACDLVSRQDAIDAVMDEFRRIPTSAIRAKTRIEALPSAQPDVPDTNVGDIISRQAAIDALDGEIEITGRTNAEAVKGYVRLVKDRLERLPSAQPDLSEYSDKLWRSAYERGKRDAQPEIIRCEDCKYWKHDHTCREHSLVSPMMANEFCSRAERRKK